MTEVHIVESESGNGTYRVQLGEDGEVHCNCKSFEFSPWPKSCKHIRKIQAEGVEHCPECKGVMGHEIGCPVPDKAH